MQTLSRVTWLRLLALFAVLVVGLACKGEGDVKSDRPPAERAQPIKKIRIAKISVKGTGPYSVFIHASRPTKSGSDQIRETVAGGRYTSRVDYSSGMKVQIKVSITGSPRDTFDCEIDDGLANTDRDHNRGQVYCEIFTAR